MHCSTVVSILSFTSSPNNSRSSISITDQKDDKIISDYALSVLNLILNVTLTQILCVLGSATNVINMAVIVRMGFSDTINISLMALAVSDFGACFVLIWRNFLRIPWIQQHDQLPFEPGEITYLTAVFPHVSFVIVTKLLTAYISFERCLCVTMPLKVKTILTKKRVKIYCVSSYILGILPILPLYYANRYDWKFSSTRNRTVYGLVFSENRLEIERVVYPIMNIFYSMIPFVIICLSTAFLVVALRKNSKWRRETASSNVSNTSTKESKISKMVVTMCIIFIICLIPQVLGLLAANVFPEVSFEGKHRNVLQMLATVIYAFEALNSSCNMFVYFFNSSVYRATITQMCNYGRKPSKDKSYG